MESLNQAENSLSEPISSISEQIDSSARVYTHAHTPARTHSRPHYAGAYAHERARIRSHNAHIYAQAHSISKANWTGTAVPSSGYVEDVYFNINLSINDVIDILDTLDLVPIDENGGLGYIPYANINGVSFLIYKNNEGRWYFNYVVNNSSSYFWSSKKGYEEGVVSFPLELNSENIVENYASQMGQNMQNNKLSALFSITPFQDISNSELSIGNLFAQLGNAIIIFGGAVVNVFISMEPIFWNNGPTLIFILLIASVSFALVFWGIELLISLIGVFKTKRKKKK